MKGFTQKDCHPGLQYLDQLEVWKGGAGFGLDNIRRVLNSLGNPQDAVRSIHVTGTNGKGTVSTVISSILGAAGYRVGMNISPHLEQINERIVVDGLPIESELISKYALTLKEASERVGVVLSFHEAITAVSFIAFQDLEVDWIVIEVGLGGALDASNVIGRPEVSVITSIDLDHQHILGDTRPQIASAKAGIIKEASQVVIGPLDNESFEVVRAVAESKGSPLYALHFDFDYMSIHDGDARAANDHFEFRFKDSKPFEVRKIVRGRHQLDNFSVALATAKLVGISDQACILGALNAFWPSRLEVIDWKNRVIIMDCAHNPHGVRALVDNLKYWGIGKIDVAFGVLDTKDWKSMIDCLLPFASTLSLLTPDSERALEMGEVVSYLSGIGVKNMLYGRDISQFIRDHEGGEGALLITGSIYLIGELRRYLGLESRRLWIKN